MKFPRRLSPSALPLHRPDGPISIACFAGTVKGTVASFNWPATPKSSLRRPRAWRGCESSGDVMMWPSCGSSRKHR